MVYESNASLIGHIYSVCIWFDDSFMRVISKLHESDIKVVWEGIRSWMVMILMGLF